MGLDDTTVVDAVGVDKTSRSVVHTILDSWDWSNELEHLEALQAQLNAYFVSIEIVQLVESYPSAERRNIVIDVVTRIPLSIVGQLFMLKAAQITDGADVEIAT